MTVSSRRVGCSPGHGGFAMDRAGCLCGSGSSRSCRSGRGGSGTQAAGRFRTGRCCAGSCSCCTPTSSRNTFPRNPADHDEVRACGIVPAIARRGTPHGSGLGVYRWVVERTFAWLHGFERHRIRSERRADIHEAFLKLACCLITHRQVLSLA